MYNNEDTPPAQSNTVDGVYCNTAAIRKEKAAEYEEVAPQIPPHTVEKLHTAVVKKPKSSANQAMVKKFHLNIATLTR